MLPRQSLFVVAVVVSSRDTACGGVLVALIMVNGRGRLGEWLCWIPFDRVRVAGEARVVGEARVAGEVRVASRGRGWAGKVGRGGRELRASVKLLSVEW